MDARGGRARRQGRAIAGGDAVLAGMAGSPDASPTGWRRTRRWSAGFAADLAWSSPDPSSECASGQRPREGHERPNQRLAGCMVIMGYLARIHICGAGAHPLEMNREAMGNDCQLPSRVADAECRIPMSEMQVLEDFSEATESFFRSP